MEFPKIIEKPENKYSGFYDVWKSIKQGITVAAPAALVTLAFLKDCSGLEDTTIPILGGITAAVVVNALYRFIKTAIIEGKPMV